MFHYMLKFVIRVSLYFNQLSGPVPLPVAILGGQIHDCKFERVVLQHPSLPSKVRKSNPGLFIPDSQDYMAADLDNDGFICGIALSTPSS